MSMRRCWQCFDQRSKHTRRLSAGAGEMNGYTMGGHAPHYGIKIAGQFAASKTREAVKMYGKFQAGSAQPHYKRSHKKSRMGCVTCKQRRVKCDEARPTCERCRARGLDCSYQEWVPRSQISVPESEGSTNSTDTLAGPSSASTEGVEEEVVSETDLAHHFISHTSKTLAMSSTDEAQTHSWCVVVPALAVTSTAVRSGMLALAACCIYTHAPRDAEEEKAALLQVAYSHYNACLRESGSQLQKLDQAEHVDSIVATTRILFALGLAFCRIERRLGKSLADSECWAWIPLLRGNVAVQDSIESSGRENEAALLGQDMEPEMIPQKPYVSYDRSSQDRIDPPPALDFLRRARLSSLFSLREVLAENRSALSDERYGQYNQAIDLLDEVLAYTCMFPRIRSFIRVIFIWPTNIPQEFSEALTRGDKFALIIYAHWLMLTVLLKDLWIVDDMGRAGIFEIVARSGEWSEQEQELLVWPKRLLSASI